MRDVSPIVTETRTFGDTHAHGGYGGEVAADLDDEVRCASGVMFAGPTEG